MMALLDDHINPSRLLCQSSVTWITSLFSPGSRIRLRYFFVFIVLAFLFLPSNILFGANVFEVNSELIKTPINEFVEYVVDPTNSLGIQTISSPEFNSRFIPTPQKSSFGYSSATYWFRFAARNPTSKIRLWYLEHPYPVIDEIDFFQPSSRGFVMYQSGDLRPFSRRPIKYRTSVFPVHHLPGVQIFYIRIKSSGAIVVPLIAWEADAFERNQHTDLAFQWVYYGIMLATIFYNLFIFLSVREASYLYLIIFIIGCSLFTMTHNGLAFQQFWPNSTHWANACHPFFAFVTIIGSLLFARAFLITRRNTPAFDRLYYLLLIAGVVLMFTPFVLEYRYATQCSVIYAALCAVAMIAGGVFLLTKGLRQARFFISAWSAYIFGTILISLKSYGLLPSNIVTDSGIQLGTGLLVIILSFGLADKINTIRKEREKALDSVRESEKRYRLLAENVQDVIWTMDLQTMKINYITPSVTRFRGFTPQEAIQLGLDKTLTPESKAMALETISKEIEEDKTTDTDPNRSKTLELEYYHKDGSTLWAEVTTSFLRDQHNHPVGIVGVSRDISARKKAEKEKSLLEFQLRQASKMEAIGTLAGGIAHDFNNILSAIMGYVEICLHESPRDSKIAFRLRRVLTACDRAKDLVRQILSFSRRDEYTKKPVCLNLIIREVLKLIKASLPATITIRKKIADEKMIIMADPTQIHQVTMNLCANAADAMRKNGGSLSVSLDSVEIDVDTATQYMNLKSGQYARLTISDTGHGMDRDTMDRIFDPFFTTKEPGRGTGMGLSLAHGIVSNLGGAIYLYSEPDKGSTFHVFLPKTEEARILSVSGEKQIEFGHERILYIDDEEFIIDMAREMISSLGYHVTIHQNSLEALALFQKHHNQFDLVITDQTMPDLTGINLAKKILEIRPDIPIILCTGFTDLIELETVQSIGIRKYIMKPYSKADISRAIREVINQSKENGS